MKAISALSVLAFTLAVNAHFQVAFPGPRGPFVEDDEPNFCGMSLYNNQRDRSTKNWLLSTQDGFTQVTKNRTEFPLSGGFFSFNSEHPKWSGE